ncbi:hypothetical protein PFFVO_06150, partial [Plasmodium falciparum Vietnam Oak-Knoll (FVO)]
GNTGEATGKSGSDSSSSGSICVPPRRRKLYIHKVENDGINDDASLRDWFIETAAIETFFLWHRYKKEKEKEEKERKERQDGLYTSSVDEKPQNKLEKGEIPEEFKRQMFYTLADYKDILDGKDIVGDTNNSGDNKDTVTLKQKIDNFFEQSGKNQESSRPQKNATENPRKKWWKTNGQHIWNGMICALTYKDNSETEEKKNDDTNKPILDDIVQKAFFGENNPDKPDNQNGTYNDRYKYETVELKEEVNGAKSTSPSSGEKTYLSKFVLRPTYFRWLEEWGEEFCRKQKHKLYIIKKECYKDGDKNCSGDGFDCDDESTKKEDIFKDFDCPTCARHCRFYKKWIKIKKEEFVKQKEAYDGQQKNCQTENNGAEGDDHDKEFCAKLKETYTDVPKFLKRLKNGPCSKNDDDSVQDKTGNNHINFENIDETFAHEKYCDPCSKFKVECNGNDKCSGGSTQKKCNGTTVITAENFKDKIDCKDVFMRVSDSNKTGFDDLKDCEKAGIFKGIRKDVWECGEYCGVHVCTLKKNVNNGKDEKHIIMKEFVKRWLEYFFEDYNKIKHKISH